MSCPKALWRTVELLFGGWRLCLLIHNCHRCYFSMRHSHEILRRLARTAPTQSSSVISLEKETTKRDEVNDAKTGRYWEADGQGARMKDGWQQRAGEREVKEAVDVQNILTRGGRNRSIGKTDMNEHSSRSHLILTIFVYDTDRYTVIESNKTVPF